jgi:hypothetical protein
VTTLIGDSLPIFDGAPATLYVNFFLMISQLLRIVTVTGADRALGGRGL